MGLEKTNYEDFKINGGSGLFFASEYPQGRIGRLVKRVSSTVKKLTPSVSIQEMYHMPRGGRIDVYIDLPDNDTLKSSTFEGCVERGKEGDGDYFIIGNGFSQQISINGRIQPLPEGWRIRLR